MFFNNNDDFLEKALEKTTKSAVIIAFAAKVLFAAVILRLIRKK